MKYCILTNDVELTSIVNNSLNLETGRRVLNRGVPKLLALYAKYEIKSTFFITGKFIESFPEVIKMIENEGHEIGSHGYSHEVDQAFDVLSLDEQIEHLSLSKSLFSKYGLNDIVSFRAPALRVNEFTATALQETGFKFDSSIASQRFDFFLSFGGLKKLKWLSQPRRPYFIKKDSFYKKGKEQVLRGKLFAFPSYAEAMSMMLLEVASLGVPIICSDIETNKDILTDSEVLLFESGNSKDLQKKIEWALSNDDKMKEKAIKAKNKVEENYLWSEIAQGYKEIYEELTDIHFSRK